MPCRTYDENDTIGDLIKERDLVTNLLCGLLRKVEEALDAEDKHNAEGIEIIEKALARPGLAKWWKKHKEQDRRREREERKRRAAEKRSLQHDIKRARERLAELENLQDIDPIDGPQDGDPFIRLMKPGTKGMDKRGKLHESSLNEFVVSFDETERGYAASEFVWDERRRAWKFEVEPWNL